MILQVNFYLFRGSCDSHLLTSYSPVYTKKSGFFIHLTEAIAKQYTLTMILVGIILFRPSFVCENSEPYCRQCHLFVNYKNITSILSICCIRVSRVISHQKHQIQKQSKSKIKIYVFNSNTIKIGSQIKHRVVLIMQYKRNTRCFKVLNSVIM